MWPRCVKGVRADWILVECYLVLMVLLLCSTCSWILFFRFGLGKVTSSSAGTAKTVASCVLLLSPCNAVGLLGSAEAPTYNIRPLRNEKGARNTVRRTYVCTLHSGRLCDGISRRRVLHHPPPPSRLAL